MRGEGPGGEGQEVGGGCTGKVDRGQVGGGYDSGDQVGKESKSQVQPIPQFWC